MNENTQYTHCPCCKSLCKVGGRNKEGSTRYFVPIDSADLAILKQENDKLGKVIDALRKQIKSMEIELLELKGIEAPNKEEIKECQH